MKPLIYLAGPIAGATSHELSWRPRVAGLLRDCGLIPLSPMRGKDKLAAAPAVSRDFHEYEHTDCFHSAPGIMARDFNDVRRSDVILVNLAGRNLATLSIGTTMELAWAYQLRKPVVAILDKGTDLLNHPMMVQAVGPFVVDNELDAVSVVNLILGDLSDG